MHDAHQRAPVSADGAEVVLSAGVQAGQTPMDVYVLVYAVGGYGVPGGISSGVPGVLVPPFRCGGAEDGRGVIALPDELLDEDAVWIRHGRSRMGRLRAPLRDPFPRLARAPLRER